MNTGRHSHSPTTRDDAALVAAFENGTLPHEDWNHEAHLRVAFCYLSQHAFEEAMERIRAGLKNYLSAKEIINTATQGYHETMTQLWMHVIAALMAGHAGERTKQSLLQKNPTGSAEFIERNAFLLEKSLWRMFYSRRQMVSIRAKQEFVPPDITPLPSFDDAKIPR
ncbi:MAG: hypothetical protein MPJ50_03840 [Pirellulales bacterium]|nr:hypothetical protein [Pirellulales bacterium]